MSGLLLGRPLSARTQLLFLSLAVTQLGRVLLAGFPFTATSALAGRYASALIIAHTLPVTVISIFLVQVAVRLRLLPALRLPQTVLRDGADGVADTSGRREGPRQP